MCPRAFERIDARKWSPGLRDPIEKTGSSLYEGGIETRRNQGLFNLGLVQLKVAISRFFLSLFIYSLAIKLNVASFVSVERCKTRGVNSRGK